MDNLTHSLAGLAVGELIDRSLPPCASEEKRTLRRKLIVFSSVAANNFPDLDFVLNPLLPPPINYLLLHRGHTHTFLWALPQALIMVFIIWICWPMARRLLREERSARTGFAVALLLGQSLHFAFDYLNSYGIHPFHPFDSHWYYGDMVFIIEPMLWAILGTAFFASLRGKVWPVVGPLFLLGIPLYFTFTGHLPWPSFVALVLVTVGLFIFQKKSLPGSRRAFVLTLVLSFVFFCVQRFTSGMGRNLVEAGLAGNSPTAVVRDVAMSPLPTNPFCWTFHSLSSDETSDSYSIRSGLVSPFPGLVSVTTCSTRLLGEVTIENVEGAVAWLQGREGSLSELRRLGENCFVSAWLRFARIPYVQAHEAVDVRFSRLSRNFTTLTLVDFEGKECPAFVPEWIPPRKDILQGQVRN